MQDGETHGDHLDERLAPVVEQLQSGRANTMHGSNAAGTVAAPAKAAGPAGCSWRQQPRSQIADRPDGVRDDDGFGPSGVLVSGT